MKKKQGISLIVLVITIIVMIILAATVMITLSNTGIIGKAHDAVKSGDLSSVRNLASLAWADSFLDGARTQEELEAGVKSALGELYDKYNVIVTNNGVTVTVKVEPNTPVVGNIVPEGGAYIDAAGNRYESGMTMPTPTEDDQFIYGDYIYTYISKLEYTDYYNDYIREVPGWKVELNEDVTDKEQEKYGEILSKINGASSISMESLFYNCENMKVAPVIPNSMIDINWAFSECISMTKPPVIPYGVENISMTFDCCENLVEFPELPETIIVAEYAFEYCTKLPKIKDLDHLTNLYSMQGMFEGCESLTKVPKLPEGVYDVCRIYYGCISLKEVPTFPSTAGYFGSTFRDCESLESAEGLLDEIAPGADLAGMFEGCLSLKVAPKIPKNAADLSGMFEYCTSLETYEGAAIGTKKGDFSGYVIPDGVSNLNDMFEGCESIVKPPVIPQSATNISWMFSDCINLEQAPEIPANVVKMRSAFSGCTKLTGNVVVHGETDDVIEVENCFSDTEKPIHIVGSRPACIYLATAANNGNVTADAKAIVPEGCTYYSGLGTSHSLGNYAGATKVYNAGDIIPYTELYKLGDVFVQGDYEYKLGCEGTSSGWEHIYNYDYCWGVKVRDNTKTAYEDMRQEIFGYPVGILSYTYYNCKNLIEAPKLSKYLMKMVSTFSGNTSLTTAPYIYSDSCSYMNFAFYGCTNLTGTITIDIPYISYATNCFSKTSKPIVLTGKCDSLAKLAATSSNGNVTVSPDAGK